MRALSHYLTIPSSCHPARDHSAGEIERAWSDYKASRSTLLIATALTNTCVRHAAAWANRLEEEHPSLNRIEPVLACAYLHGAVQFARASLGTIGTYTYTPPHPLNIYIYLCPYLSHNDQGERGPAPHTFPPCMYHALCPLSHPQPSLSHHIPQRCLALL